MVTLLAGYANPLHREDLKREGFTDQQLDTLERLRAIYPYVEFLQPDEVRRVQFVRWLYQRGQFSQ